MGVDGGGVSGGSVSQAVAAWCFWRHWCLWRFGDSGGGGIGVSGGIGVFFCGLVTLAASGGLGNLVDAAGGVLFTGVDAGCIVIVGVILSAGAKVFHILYMGHGH